MIWTGLKTIKRASLFVLVVLAPLAMAGPADVIDTSVDCSNRLCRFHVTVQHDDEGWDHYADGILVLTDDGRVIGNRPLRHPHTGQSSFTRTVQSLLPDGVQQVIIKVHDSVHGFSGQSMTIKLPSRETSTQ